MKFKSCEELAKYTIIQYLKRNTLPQISPHDVPKKLLAEKACFVTVYIKDNLRGCIGCYTPTKPLYRHIIENAIAAVSSDYRFNPISQNELADLTVEVSILTPPKEKRVDDITSFLEYLEKEKPGVILEKYGRKALFLPQVWGELPDPTDFLTQLSLKAGLGSEDWQEGMRFWIFRNEKI